MVKEYSMRPWKLFEGALGGGSHLLQQANLLMTVQAFRCVNTSAESVDPETRKVVNQIHQKYEKLGNQRTRSTRLGT
jgi:hypothetical protein